MLLPVQRVAADGALMLVDGTSAAGAVAVDVAATDVYYFAPQKAFAAEAGHLAGALLAGRARARRRADRDALGAADARSHHRRRQLAQGPDVQHPGRSRRCGCWPTRSSGCSTQGGLDWAAARTRESSGALYEWATASDYATPFVADPALRSPVVGTIDLDDAVDAATVVAVLRANGIVDTDSYRGLKRNQLRIGMFPAVDPDDVRALTACVDHVVSAL